jgi:hypothetical protein
MPLDDEDAKLWYGKKLPLKRYVVLEYAADSWHEWLKHQEDKTEALREKVARGAENEEALTKREELLERQRQGHSRLFLVDAGSSPATLRAEYPDRGRYVVTLALIRIEYRREWDPETQTLRDPYLTGSISEILVESIHVPRRYRGVIDATLELDRHAAGEAGKKFGMRYLFQGAHPPRYQVALRYGLRYEPWLTGIRPLEPENP